MKNNSSREPAIVGQSVLISQEYRDFIADLKSARISAARAMNSEAILLYWDIGQGIVERQRSLGWGESVVELVSGDLRREFPQATGFSARSVWDMRRFYLFYTAHIFWMKPRASFPRLSIIQICSSLSQKSENHPLR